MSVVHNLVGFFLTYWMLSASKGAEPLLPDRPTQQKILTRCSIFFFGQSFFYYAYSRLPIHISITILNCSSVWTYLCSVFISAERLRFSKILSIFLSLLGIFCVLNQHILASDPKGNGGGQAPSVPPYPLLALLTIFFCSMTKGVSNVVIASLGPANPLHTLLYLSLTGVLSSSLLLLLSGGSVSFTQRSTLVLLLLGAGGNFLFQNLKILSLRYERATVISLIDALSVPFAFLWAWKINGAETTGLGWAGGAFATLGVVGFSLADRK